MGLVVSDGWTYLPATLRCPTEPLSCAPPRTRSSQPATLSGSPSRVPPRGCCVRRRSLRAACWGERVAGRLVKFFESRGGSACLQQAHQKSSHTGQKSFAESGTYLRPPPRRGVRLRRALKPVPLPAHGRHSRQALACWGVRAASGPVKFFGPRARTQTGGPETEESSGRQRLTRGQSPLGFSCGTCQVARLRRREGG